MGTPRIATSVSAWDTRQAELWDRIFQATQDIAAVAESLGQTNGGRIVSAEMIKAATKVGVMLVRANAADEASIYIDYIREARVKAIETDYWLRVAYILQEQTSVQRDVSGVVRQYAAIIDALQKLTQQTPPMRMPPQRKNS